MTTIILPVISSNIYQIIVGIGGLGGTGGDSGNPGVAGENGNDTNFDNLYIWPGAGGSGVVNKYTNKYNDFINGGENGVGSSSQFHNGRCHISGSIIGGLGGEAGTSTDYNAGYGGGGGGKGGDGETIGGTGGNGGNGGSGFLIIQW